MYRRVLPLLLTAVGIHHVSESIAASAHRGTAAERLHCRAEKYAAENGREGNDRTAL